MSKRKIYKVNYVEIIDKKINGEVLNYNNGTEERIGLCFINNNAVIPYNFDIATIKLLKSYENDINNLKNIEINNGDIVDINDLSIGGLK